MDHGLVSVQVAALDQDGLYLSTMSSPTAALDDPMLGDEGHEDAPGDVEMKEQEGEDAEDAEGEDEEGEGQPAAAGGGTDDSSEEGEDDEAEARRIREGFIVDEDEDEEEEDDSERRRRKRKKKRRKHRGEFPYARIFQEVAYTVISRNGRGPRRR